MWPLRSLCHRTDLFLTGFDGEVVDRGRYVVVRTPSNPGYWWGNFLLYPEPPDDRAAAPSGEASWREDHARELGNVAATLLTWDRPDGALGDVGTFLDDGFAIDESAVLTASEKDLVRPKRSNDDVRVVPVASDAEWAEAAGTLTRAFSVRRSGTVDDVRQFVDRQLARYRRMQQAKLGQWYGAILGGRMAGALGVVRVPVPDARGAVGRFQLVGVDPELGRQGVCSTLVYDVARRVLAEENVATLVMAADGTYHAAKIYESVGFKTTEVLRSLLKKPPPA